jgi:hypothetical protein
MLLQLIATEPKLQILTIETKYLMFSYLQILYTYRNSACCQITVHLPFSYHTRTPYKANKS